MIQSVVNAVGIWVLETGSRVADGSSAAATLTPRQRWEAMQGFKTVMTERWFTISGLVAIGLLSVLLFYVSFRRKKEELRVSSRMFDEYAGKCGLTGREKKLLRDISRRAGLRRDESIFTLSSAFDRGAGQMMQELLDGEPSPDDVRNLRMELSFLREKLGFKTRPSYSAGTTVTNSSQLTSRQIPVGRKIHMTRRRGRDGEIEATVVENTDAELAVRLDCHVKINFGEFWCVRYYFGASVWEFDSSVVSFDGNVIGLNHSESVRFINRRRFLRVPVRRQGYVASFPFVVPCDENSPNEDRTARQGGIVNASGQSSWSPPKFAPALITELAGPGLRIEADIKVKTGDRVLVIFNLDEDVDAVEEAGETGARKQTGKVVENIGEVRHVMASPGGLSIAVELTFLSDSAVGELIRATNAAAVKAKMTRAAKGAANPDVAGSADSDDTFASPEDPVIEEEVGHV